jgi:hypothetical protein
VTIDAARALRADPRSPARCWCSIFAGGACDDGKLRKQSQHPHAVVCAKLDTFIENNAALAWRRDARSWTVQRRLVDVKPPALSITKHHYLESGRAPKQGPVSVVQLEGSLPFV